MSAAAGARPGVPVSLVNVSARATTSLACHSASRERACPITRACATSSSRAIVPLATRTSQVHSASMSPSVNTASSPPTSAKPMAIQSW
jgi:hypothetical protein